MVTHALEQHTVGLYSTSVLFLCQYYVIWTYVEAIPLKTRVPHVGMYTYMVSLEPRVTL
jgi:hypothetical protein